MALDKSKGRSSGQSSDDDDDEESDEELLVGGVNDMEVINSAIPPYKKGAAQITGLSSLSLISRSLSSFSPRLPPEPFLSAFSPILSGC